MVSSHTNHTNNLRNVSTPYRHTFLNEMDFRESLEKEHGFIISKRNRLATLCETLIDIAYFNPVIGDDLACDIIRM